GPFGNRRDRRVVDRLLGEIEVAEQADERRQDAAGFGPVEVFDLRPRPIRLVLHGDDHVISSIGVAQRDTYIAQIGRTSMLPMRADGIFAATWIASFRSRASIM